MDNGKVSLGRVTVSLYPEANREHILIELCKNRDTGEPVNIGIEVTENTIKVSGDIFGAMARGMIIISPKVLCG